VDAAIERSEELLEAYPDAAAARLALAATLLHAKRPGRALDHLAALDRAPLTLAQQERRAALEAEARGSLGTGLELE
jgi:hypothetical protein